MKNHQRTRGALLLAEVGETQAEIAVKLGTGRVQVAYFMTGQRRPGALNRARLKSLYKIPIRAWDDDLAGERAPAVVLSTAADSVDARILRLQRMIDAIQEEALSDQRTTRREKLSELKAAIEATALLAKLTGESQEISEVRLLKLPVLRRVVEDLLKALEPWPEAMRAAGEVLTGGGE